jgi:hypothetical protein
MHSFESGEKDGPRHERWGRIREEVDYIVDGIGKHIDPGIKDAVTAFRYLEFPTNGSCEGRMHGKSNAPWIHFDFIPEPLKGRLEQAKKAAGGKWNDPTVEGLIQEAQGRIISGGERLMALLDEFYKDRNVPSGQRLSLDFYPGSVRLQSQGAATQKYYRSELKERHLKEFQEEMIAFTKFIKEKILLGNDFGSRQPPSTPCRAAPACRDTETPMTSLVS